MSVLDSIIEGVREDLAAQGVIFLDTDTGLKEHPEIFKEYFQIFLTCLKSFIFI